MEHGMHNIRLKDIGEKEIIRRYIKPLFNPLGMKDLVGDDCAIVDVSGKTRVCLSTDRVPADLISFKLGIIDYFGIGYYLVILNISDIVSSGAYPIGLLLTLAFQENFLLEDFKQFLMGVKKACDEYKCNIIGGDLSNSSEMSISATSVGLANSAQILYRSGAYIGDYVFCSDFLGITATAFAYFLEAHPKGLNLSHTDEAILKDQFRKPYARISLSESLAHSELRVTCMDNTDGVGQSLLELSEINNMSMILLSDKIPIHPISKLVAEYLEKDIVDIALGAGADFQLIGTIQSNLIPKETENRIGNELRVIGYTKPGNGVYIQDEAGCLTEHNVTGWNYYITK
jgi:thiamine-monophosphate kinase